MPVLGNPRHERAAQSLAAGGSAEDAAAAAGYDTKASSFSANARKLIQRPEIRERLKELQGQIAACMVIDVAWIKERVGRIANTRVPEDEVKASDVIAANRLLAQMTPDALVPQKVAPTNPEGDGPATMFVDVSDNDRLKALSALLAKHRAKDTSAS